jgi:hypothetical protein
VFSLLLVTKWFRASITVRDWVLLCAFSLGLFVSSLFFYREDPPIEEWLGNISDTPTCYVIEALSCDRVLLGICLGLVTAIISLILLVWTTAPSVVHVIVGSVLFVAWCCAVGFLTYGSGHGVAAGSVYLESWAGLFLTLDVATTNIVLLLRQRQSETDQNDDDHDHDPLEGDGMDGNVGVVLAARDEGGLVVEEEEKTLEAAELQQLGANGDSMARVGAMVVDRAI